MVKSWDNVNTPNLEAQKRCIKLEDYLKDTNAVYYFNCSTVLTAKQAMKLKEQCNDRGIKLSKSLNDALRQFALSNNSKFMIYAIDTYKFFYFVKAGLTITQLVITTDNRIRMCSEINNCFILSEDDMLGNPARDIYYTSISIANTPTTVLGNYMLEYRDCLEEIIDSLNLR